VRFCLRETPCRLRRLLRLYFLVIVGAGVMVFPLATDAVDRDASKVEVLNHEWRSDEVWLNGGKTKFLWNATIRNNSEVRKRVYVYYSLLDDNNVPLARNVANKYVGPGKTTKILANSYIMTVDLPRVTHSSVTIKVGITH